MNEVVGLLRALAIFFIVLATLGLFHSLAMSTRNGRQDFGILGALGLLRRNARHVVTWQACVAAIVGLAIGVLFGVIIGRAAWNLMVNNIAMLEGPQIPWLALVLTMVVGVATAAAIAWPIGYHFTRGLLARLLRVE